MRRRDSRDSFDRDFIAINVFLSFFYFIIFIKSWFKLFKNWQILYQITKENFSYITNIY